jgi:hypothetical protein
MIRKAETFPWPLGAVRLDYLFVMGWYQAHPTATSPATTDMAAAIVNNVHIGVILQTNEGVGE